MFKLDVTRLVQEFSFLEIKGKHIIVSYRNKKGRQPKPLKLNKFILIDQKFFEGLGLYIGECEKGPNLRRISFTNGDLEILIFMIYWLEFYIGVNKDSMIFSVIGSKNSKLKRLNKKWSSLLGCSINQFNNPGIPKTNPGNIERVRICYHSVFLSKVITKLSDFALNLCKSNKSLGIGFLRGYYAAEGCPVVRRNRGGTLDRVNLCGKDFEMLKLIRCFLNANSIKPGQLKKCEKGRNKDGQYELNIFGYENFIKLKKLDIFKNSKYRNKIFLECISRFKRVGVPEWSNGLGLGSA